MPPFENVVAEKKVTVTPEQMTCGLRDLFHKHFTLVSYDRGKTIDEE